MPPCWSPRVTARALAEALDAVLAGPAGDGPARDRRRRRGLEIVARHTWAASADRHLEAYCYAAGRSR